MGAIKPTKPGKAFFAPQFFSLMIGAPDRNIKDGDDVCRFAADCGLAGINLPIGMINVPRMLEDDEFFGKTVDHYRSLGTPIVGVSSHTDGQLVSVHSAHLPRFKDFAPEDQREYSVRTQEMSATKRICDGLRLGKKLGTTLHQTFPGGRGVPHHDQWSTLQEKFRELALLHLALQWQPIADVAAECGQRLGFEIGHVMEGIQSVDDLTIFHDFIEGDAAKRAIKWGVDTSHFDKEGDDAIGEVDRAIEADLDIPGHAKDAIFDMFDGGRHRQNALPFAKQAGKFCTFGTMSAGSANQFGKVLWRDHKRTPTGSHAVLEGEDMFILDPFQAMEIGAQNLDLIIDGKAPIRLDQIALKSWTGKTFEDFAKSSVPISSLLELNMEELTKLCEAAEKHGLPRPQ
ncbi:MAG: hypothetical protein V4481_05690 [Patescibacteria group bacterium]